LQRCDQPLLHLQHHIDVGVVLIEAAIKGHGSAPFL
jgi:hypothetical protein